MEILAGWWLWISTITALICVLILILRPSNNNHGNGRLPPGPRPLPVVGNLFLLGSHPHRSLARLAKAHGPIMSLKLGAVTHVVVSSPDAARQVLQANDQALCGRAPPDTTRALRYNEASIAWQTTTPLWRTHRRICSTQLFSPARLEDRKGLRQLKMRALVAHLRRRSAAGKAVDVGRTAFTTVMNLISSTLFSVDMADLESESDESSRAVVWAFMEAAGLPNVSDFFPVLAAMDLQGARRRATALLRKVMAIFDEFIDRRLKERAEGEPDHESSSGSGDFLDSLIDSLARDEIDRHSIKSLLLDLFLAGTDTSSSTLEWAMTELLRHPGAMERARVELVRIIGRREVEEPDIQRLPYLRAVVKETLRLHPPGPLLIPHRAETDAELGGYVVPVGTRVIVNAWAIGRDGDIWKDPDVFDPERFMDSGVDYWGRDFELIPFGSGRRMCPGLPLAHRMVHLPLASMLHSFRWNLPDGVGPMDIDTDEKFGLTLAKVAPLMAIPIMVDI